ncbi:hypothetical protein [Halomonas sp. GFAJ-1]|uniref:hypothetical protein n=1 Tax=Halomonas sp. GFAJ-1 TaxID=1118153 RepID=UPI00023A4730|nr:hypothetical protein [Halomonas sp. GFAJ-1]AVI62349.1 hypothetical protein BB497_06345 [Halomonas sp. GFAJ-1]EHK59752.1 hypothetical protein MOY_14872 [Halomonas sp. GFAJ-1]
MEGFDRGFASILRELEAGLQQAIYYAIFIDLVLLLALGVFIWCCCVYVINYKFFVEEDIIVKRAEKQYFSARAERERLEAKRLKLELGLADDLNKMQRGLYGE